jgi:hypothetical protein
MATWSARIANVAQDVFDDVVRGLDNSTRVLKAVHAKGGALHVLNKGLYGLRHGDGDEELVTTGEEEVHEGDA